MKSVLIIGGTYQNKLEIAFDRFSLNPDDIAENFDSSKPIWNDFHESFKHYTGDSSLLLQKSQGKIIICDEIGCGIIPLDKANRELRENLGRFLCEFAKNADLVLRVQCGIAQVIKEK